MQTSRYEEYLRFEDGVPFVFHDRLVRRSSMGVRRANWHENLELQLADEGKGSLLLDGVGVPLEVGMVAVVNSGVIHRTDPEGYLVYSCMILDSEFCRRAGFDVQSLCFEPLISDPALVQIFLQIRAAYADTSYPCRAARLQMLALSLLIHLREHYTRASRVRKTGGCQTAKAAMEYIRAHDLEPISLQSVASAIYVNKHVLARRFKAATGETVVSYVHACRCKRAAAMLDAVQAVMEKKV